MVLFCKLRELRDVPVLVVPKHLLSSRSAMAAISPSSTASRPSRNGRSYWRSHLCRRHPRPHRPYAHRIELKDEIMRKERPSQRSAGRKRRCRKPERESGRKRRQTSRKGGLTASQNPTSKCRVSKARQPERNNFGIHGRVNNGIGGRVNSGKGGRLRRNPQVIGALFNRLRKAGDY